MMFVTVPKDAESTKAAMKRELQTDAASGNDPR
jgi:hypothetical protein